ncbi:ThiF family adenylyltransferase [Roseovarius sp.]|uniref:HesA/MoeB/ThiF family protein n=1 Tax=Roseovarius sp. TaxID=1486281 RepID=UPI003517B34F
MLSVLILMGIVWGAGRWLGWPAGLRWGLVALIWAVVVLLHLTLPATSGLRQATGDTAAPWVILAGLALLVAGYAAILRALKRRTAQGPEDQAAKDQAAKPTFSEAELDRYARHIVLRELGGPGQKRLKSARVLVVGAGGLGAPVLTYLAAAGVGRIGVIDHDEVSNSNLQRQVIFRDADIGRPKVEAAAEAMRALNPYVEVRPYQRRLEEDFAADLFGDYDLILDGTDNFATRYMVNRAAVAAGKPLISGAIAQWEGQLSLFDPGAGGPCYECIFPEAPAEGLAPSCAEAGVIGPLPGVIGAMMAGEAVKHITGAGTPLRGEMLIYDALYGESRKFSLSRRDDCPVCGGTTGDKDDQSAA